MSAAVLLAALLAVAPAPPAASAASAVPDTAQLAPVRGLIARVVPHDTARFRLAMIPADSGRDVFEVVAEGGRIVLRGSSGVALASGLDWYLEHVAGINISLPLQPVRLPATLPPLPHSVRITTPYRYRYFFNYCTFSYSMAWWGWPEWQRMIDWMALKGINLPLAVTGQEGTWQLTLRDLGFTDKEIGAFLVGPAYLPWGWMGNIDGLGGPLPQSWIDSHIALERQILARERSLGMMPVLQGFTGHVPASITRVFPRADVHRTGDWSAGFSGTWYLDPTDTLFQRIGRRFIERQTQLFGTSHFYAADPFNEINPPTNDSTFLAGVGRSIYGAMHAVDPSAVWVLQGWFLYYAANFWKPPQAEALLGAVPDDRLVVLDLYGDRHPVWKERDAFYGKPWVWNVLYNFGGKVSLNGNLPRIATNLQDALSSADHGKLWGLGMTMEGLGYNAIVPDYVLDMVWRDTVPPVDGWAHDWVTRRYHGFDAHAWNAWKILLATAYRSAPQTGSFLAERPQFYDSTMAYRSEPKPPYDPHELVAALDTLLT
ncbi:MAG TPA: alpha-N-acetylglucosaminidase TIM-barrel domain-containing protein, partial [Gemmatimonadales bacterium]|nr:alpha-N-acetylglucosaminidase TIM-barrel domain-containing protein [Gemmatimonadales bacterium]